MESASKTRQTDIQSTRAVLPKHCPVFKFLEQITCLEDLTQVLPKKEQVFFKNSNITAPLHQLRKWRFIFLWGVKCNKYNDICATDSFSVLTAQRDCIMSGVALSRNITPFFPFQGTTERIYCPDAQQRGRRDRKLRMFNLLHGRKVSLPCKR